MQNQTPVPTVLGKLTSTNGTINIVLFVLFSLGAVIGIEKVLIESVALAVLPFVAAIRETIMRGFKPRWDWNIPIYILSALTLALPFLSEFFDALKVAYELYLNGGNIAAILSALLVAFNIIMAIIRKDRNEGGASASQLSTNVA